MRAATCTEAGASGGKLEPPPPSSDNASSKAIGSIASVLSQLTAAVGDLQKRLNSRDRKEKDNAGRARRGSGSTSASRQVQFDLRASPGSASKRRASRTRGNAVGKTTLRGAASTSATIGAPAHSAVTVAAGCPSGQGGLGLEATRPAPAAKTRKGSRPLAVAAGGSDGDKPRRPSRAPDCEGRASSVKAKAKSVVKPRSVSSTYFSSITTYGHHPRKS